MRSRPNSDQRWSTPRLIVPLVGPGAWRAHTEAGTRESGAGFLGATRADGKPFLDGRKVTGFSWPEEKLAGRNKVVPFLLDERLKAEGASYTKALRPRASKVVTDGNLVTGQNPASAESVAKQVVKLLKKAQ